MEQPEFVCEFQLYAHLESIIILVLSLEQKANAATHTTYRGERAFSPHLFWPVIPFLLAQHTTS